MSADEELTAAYDYDLPSELIAQYPTEPRDAARLLVLCGDDLGHARFSDLPKYLAPGDVLVLNETRVIRARLLGRRATGGTVEVLLLRPAAGDRYDPNARRWLALLKPAKRLRPSEEISFGELGSARVCEENAAHGGREIELLLRLPFESFLERAGKLPLPPYVHDDSEAAQRGYQTIFARNPGSVAAPTASLHFTENVLDALGRRGVQIVKLTLNVGLGTFKPMQTQHVIDHRMHAESYDVPQETVTAVEQAKREGRRIVASGTTVVRALEGCAAQHGRIKAGHSETSLFITPGFRFRCVDALITNFHLPRSTLLVLVSAFAGREQIFRAYREAIAQRYRFFSFGDAMLLLPAAPISR